MLIIFMMLLLGVGCGYVGKFCIDMLGGSGNYWLMYWEVLCLLYFLFNIWILILFFIFYGLINILDKVKDSMMFLYWMSFMFFFMLMFFLLLWGFMFFVSFGEWINYFLLWVMRFVLDEDWF